MIYFDVELVHLSERNLSYVNIYSANKLDTHIRWIFYFKLVTGYMDYYTKMIRIFINT